MPAPLIIAPVGFSELDAVLRGGLTVLMLSGSPDSEYTLLRAESRGPVEGKAGGGMDCLRSSWGIEEVEGTRAAAAGGTGRTGLKREEPRGGTRDGDVGPEPGEGPRYMLLTRVAGFPNSEFERRCAAGAPPMDMRFDCVRARGMRGAVLGSSFKVGCGSEAVSMGFGRPPRTTEVARLRREGCSSFSGGGGGSSLFVGRAFEVVAESSAPDMRFGVLSRMFSNSLCCSKREMMLLMYNVRALF